MGFMGQKTQPTVS